MIAVIPAAPAAYPVSTLSAPGSISRLARTAASLVSVPSVILTFGATSAVPLTYSAAGLFEPLFQSASTSRGAFGSPAATANTAGNATTAQSLAASTTQALAAMLAPNVNSSSAGGADTLTVSQALDRQLLIDFYSTAAGLDAATAASVINATGILQGLPPASAVQAANSLLSNNLGPPATTLLAGTETAATTAPTGRNVAIGSAIRSVAAEPATANPAATIAATPATAAPAAAPVVGNAATTGAGGAVSVAPAADTSLASNFVMDSVAQAAANIAGNPAYANTVAGLYINALIYRSQQEFGATPPSTSDSVQPVTVVSRVRSI